MFTMRLSSFYPNNHHLISMSSKQMEEHLKIVEKAVKKSSKSIIQQLSLNDRYSYAVIDNLLGSKLCLTYRQEAKSLYERNLMEISTSTKTQDDKIIEYSKYNVYSTQLIGGSTYYDSPRLHEYCTMMIKTLSLIINDVMPSVHLSHQFASNKLAVCIGNGSKYDKHYDNMGGNDNRKLTVLYYMNKTWRKQCGGEFRLYLPQNPDFKPSRDQDQILTDEDGYRYIDIEPIADRLLCFWSDSLIHSVQPSFAPRGDVDHRYALTNWFSTTDLNCITRDDLELNRHFPKL